MNSGQERVHRPHHVMLVRPDGYRHAEAFREVAHTLLHGLRRLGVAATCEDNRIDFNAQNIVLGGHLLGEKALASLPASTILYNFEQVCTGSMALRPRYLEALARFETWDYSQRNVARLKELLPSARPRHVASANARTWPLTLRAWLPPSPTSTSADDRKPSTNWIQCLRSGVVGNGVTSRRWATVASRRAPTPIATN